MRIAEGRLDPALAETYVWNCGEHVAAKTGICLEECCGACYFLAPGTGCQLKSMRPLRCKTYPLIPQKDRVIVHSRCPESKAFIAALERRDPKALAFLDVAVALGDMVQEKGDDNSLEIAWLMRYTRDGYGGRVVWKRGKGITVPEKKRGRAKRPAAV